MAEVNRPIELTEDDFQAFRDMIYRSIGVNLTEAKRALTISRLSRRLKELQLQTIGEYLRYVEKNPGELEIMFNLITTNVTKFFRESHHFDFLNQEYLPHLEAMASSDQDKQIRAWSAGCSTGEEPYTMAIVLNEFFSKKKGWKIKILASDINTETLKKAAEGVYSRKEVEGISYPLLKKYFKLGTGSNEGLFKVKDELKRLVTFRRVNLTAEEDFPIKQGLNFIFCRNVFIYFDKETQTRVLRKFNAHLVPGGVLMLGHSESINSTHGNPGNWRLLKHTIYEKIP